MGQARPVLLAWSHQHKRLAAWSARVCLAHLLACVHLLLALQVCCLGVRQTCQQHRGPLCGALQAGIAAAGIYVSSRHDRASRPACRWLCQQQCCCLVSEIAMGPRDQPKLQPPPSVAASSSAAAWADACLPSCNHMTGALLSTRPMWSSGSLQQRASCSWRYYLVDPVDLDQAHWY
jgi:hypothetical protein